MSLLKRIEKSGQQSQSTQSGSGSSGMNLQARRVVPPGVAAQKDTYSDLKTRVQTRLLGELDLSQDVTRFNEVRSTIQDLF